MAKTIRLFLSFVLVTGITWAQEGDLHKFEDKMEPATKRISPPPLPPPLPSSPSSRSLCEERWRKDNPGQEMPPGICAESLGEFFSDAVISPMIGAILLAPFYLPAMAIGDKYEHVYAFSSYPYENHPGYFSSTGKSWLARAEISRLWTVQEPQAWRGDLSLLTSSRFGVDVAYTRYHEHVGDESDSLAFFQIVPTFSFARSEKWDWRMGIGYEAAQGRDHHDRVKLTYQIRRYWELPLHVDLDFGISLASGKPIFEFAPGISYHWNRFELKANYRRLSISDVVLEGPGVSLAVWF